MAAFVKFWGTRGSIPTPASWTRVYGGNTPCVEVRFDDSIFICDAGSGIRELGKDLLTRHPSPRRLHLFISHTHWDHIQGFPFFEPVYMADTKIHVYGRQGDANSPYHLLSGQMSSDYFPVSFKDLGANIVDDRLTPEQTEIEGVIVRAFPLNHPGGCLGYSFEKEGRKIVYATDNELKPQPDDLFPDSEDRGPLRHAPEPLVRAASGADLLILDAQYGDKDYTNKRNWGHSPYYSATDLAIRAGARMLALFHHDPEDTDRAIDEKVELCRARAARLDSDLIIMAAREGVELKF
jgi:phosphoribosyl 1,2-cyclic phosphodiesterase